MEVSFSFSPPLYIRNLYHFFFFIQHIFKNWLYSLEENSEKTSRFSYYPKVKFILLEPKKQRNRVRLKHCGQVNVIPFKLLFFRPTLSVYLREKRVQELHKEGLLVVALGLFHILSCSVLALNQHSPLSKVKTLKKGRQLLWNIKVIMTARGSN